jgi:hypothetical protein
MDTEIIEKYGIKFLWTVSAIKYPEQRPYFDQGIRQCEEDDKALIQENIDHAFVDNLENIFEKDKNIMLFVHDSQFMFCPVYCLLLDISTPFEYSVENKVVLKISQKFKHDNFAGNTEGLFHDLLYSEENQDRLKKRCLEIRSIDHYEY